MDAFVRHETNKTERYKWQIMCEKLRYERKKFGTTKTVARGCEVGLVRNAEGTIFSPLPFEKFRFHLRRFKFVPGFLEAGKLGMYR